MNKKYRILAVVLSLMFLTACGTPETPATTEITQPEYIGNSPVPNLRTGIARQGITVTDSSVEVTKSGSYYLAWGGEDYGANGRFLIYCDHGSDTFVKLCGRPDCKHTDSSCNAFFLSGSGIQYYDGHLYITSGFGSGKTLYRLDVDGQNRVKVADISAVVTTGINGVGASRVVGDIWFFMLCQVDESGNSVDTHYYYKLDGSMEIPQQMPEGLGTVVNHGKAFLALGPDRENQRPEGAFYLWDPDTNETTWLYDRPEYHSGYASTEGFYYIADGLVCRRDSFTNDTHVLFDTGLEGDFALRAYPDFFVIMDRCLWWEDEQGTQELESQILRFYSWDFEALGEVKIDYPVYMSDYEYLICGETEERILLSAHDSDVPEYYIEKSDFGTGKIRLHQFCLPEDIERWWQELEEEAAFYSSLPGGA